MWEMLGLVVLAAMVLELKDARAFVTTGHVVLRPWDVLTGVAPTMACRAGSCGPRVAARLWS